MAIMVLKLLKRLMIAIPFCLTAAACSSSVEYLDNGSLQSSNLVSGSYKEDLIAEKGNGLKQFGAFVVKTGDKNAEPRVFVIKREKGKIMAETLLFDNTGEKNSMFEKTFLSFGANRERSSFGISFRFVY